MCVFRKRDQNLKDVKNKYVSEHDTKVTEREGLMMAGCSESKLAACTDFKERQNIRGALRELKGLKLDGDTVITYSFGPKSIKTAAPITAPKPENGKIFPKQTNYKSVDENSFLEKKYSKTPDRTCNTKTKGKRLGKETVGKDENENNLSKGNRAVNTSSLHQNVKGNNVQDRNVNQNVISRSSVNFEEIKSNFENKCVPERNVGVKKVSSNIDEVLLSEFEYKSSETSRNRSNVKEILSESFMNRVNEIKSTFEKHKEERPKFKSYFYAGTLSTPTRDLGDDSPRPAQRCVSVSLVTKEITNEHSDTKESVIKRPVSLSLKKGSSNASTPVSPKKEGTQSPRKPRKISYRTSPFSPSSQLNQISSSVSRSRLKKDLIVVDSTSEKIGPVPTTADKSASQPVTNQASKQCDTDLVGRHSVPTVSSRKLVSKHTSKILVANQTGRDSVFEQTGYLAVDHKDGHLPSKHTDRHSNKVRQSIKKQTRSQSFPEKGVTRVSFRSEKSDTTMKAETGRRLASDSSVPSQKSRNEINSEVYRDELERVRSKSQGCNSDMIMGENIMDISVQKKKVGLSRRNRVDSSDSAKSVKKFRRKGKTDDEPLTSPNTPQPHPEIVISPVNGEYHIKSVQKSSHVRRKLPEIPVSKEEQEVENDETVHERTIRLLQERRKERLDKIIKEKEVEPKSGKVKITPEKIKNLQEKLERSDSKRKACRVRRELQLLNRETKLKSPVAVNLEAEFSAILKASEAVTEKENIQTLVKRSHSDVARKPARVEIKLSCREKTTDIEKDVCSVAKEVEDLLLQPLTPDKKIDLIGSLMQEEAKLQEMLRRSTSFTDKRKMRAEVRQLREKRNALEGASLPTDALQRCASVSAGVITQATTPDGNRVTEPDFVATQPTIEDLRKQLSETTDYDEKKKIRLALRQLRQQSRDGAPTPSGLQRSQSFVHKKPSETEVKSARQSESVSLFKSQSDSESKVDKDQAKKATASKEIANLEAVSKTNCNNLERERELSDSRQSESVGKLNGNSLQAAKFSQKPPLPISNKQTDVGDGDTRVKQVEAGSLPPRAPKRHSFALGTDSKLRTQSNSFLNGSQADTVNSDNEKTIVSSKAHSDSNEHQQDGPSKDVKFKSKFASILISRANIDRRRSTSDLLSETKTISSFSSQDSEKPIRSETTSFRVTDTEDRAHKSPEKPSVKTDTDSRLTPNIEWLEDKKRTIPTPNELDKLMSSMDIEAAFSQILDAVETTPVNGDIEETIVPESPIMEEESESSTSSVIELTNIADSQPKMDEQFEENINEKNSYKEITSDVGDKSVQKQPDEIKEKSLEMQNGDVSNVHNLSGLNGDNSNGAIHEDNSQGKSEKTVQLRRDLSLDVTKHPDKSSAISVIHGDDGTVTVQEVNRMEKGDTVITEWKKLRRTNSKTETRETDTVVEKRITSPGGNSHIYEKDVSKTKRKITSRGSEYFSRNHYNIRKRKDLEGMEISEHELDSESANMSVSKNESWGERSEAKAVLNRDANNEIIPKRLSITRNEADIKSESDTKTDVRTGKKVSNRLSAGTKTSSGYGSVSPSEDDHDLGAVVEAHLGRPSGCPEITSSLQNVTVEDGCAAVLEFKCRGYPIPSLTWYKGDNPLVENNRVKLRFDDVSGKAYLEIDPVSQDDLGDYRCVLKNSLGSASTCGRLNVKTKSTTLPWFLTKLSDITVTEGQSIVLECEVSEVDTVMWFKDGIIQRNSPDLRQTFDGKIAKLEIVEVYLDDDGTYSCVISNKAGENGCSCKIAVKESQSKDSIVPMFLRKLDTQICAVGDTAIFETEVIGSPEPTVTWFANKIQLTEDSYHKMVYDGRIARLVLRNISLSYGGKIECKAENSSGKVSCDSVLVVQEVKRPPVLRTQLTNMTFVSGKAAMLECKVESDSVPDITWRKNGSIIGDMGNLKQTYLDGIAKLEIGSVCAEDSGKYDCVIKNDFGEVITSCLLTIQNDAPRLEEPKLQTKASRSEVTARRSLPASFTPKVETERIHQAKSSASKVMLVRQGSLRSMNRDGQSSLLKRTGSFHGVSLSNSSVKKVDNDESEQKSEVKDRTEKTPESMVVCSTGMRETLLEKPPKKDEPLLENRELAGELKSGATHDTVLSKEIHNDNKHSKVEKQSEKQSYKILMTEEQNKVDMNLVEHYTKDMNSNITKTVSNNIVPEDQNSKALKLEIQIDSNKSVPKVDSEKFKEKESVSEDKEKLSIKRSSFGQFDKTPVSRFKAGNELRRTQSNRTPGSEKPEWLQVKLRKVANTPLSSAEKQSIEKNPNYNSPQNTPTEVSDTPISVQKDIKLSRSQSARVVDRKLSPVLKDSTNSPSNDPARKTVKLTPVSERAKIFLANESKSPSGKSSPTDIIAKAINFSRTESLKSPMSQRPFIVQRSGSFKAEARSSQPGDITLNLSPQESQGQDKKGETGSTRKVIQIWDPTAQATTKMDYSKINDEEQLNKLLNDCENFEERKKLRARLKELREAEMKAWEAKRQAREKTQEDFIKRKHREADLEKQKKLEQFKEQAKEHHEPKHLEVAEKNLKEKYRQADIAKQKQLEAFDRMARKEDVKQTSKVTTEVSTDGKTTTTTRKVETVTSVSGKGAAGRPAEEIAPQMLKQFINATSPSVSGQLSVKTQSWSSKDGVTRTSEKTESWGGKPVNPFKAADAANAKTNPPKAMARSPSAIKTMLLEWCKAMTREYTDKIEIQNFSTSWNDGIAFCALIHHFYPEAFDFYSLDPKQRRKNFELAFDTAEKYADIAPLLDVEDMVMMKKPDWKCVFTYVQSFYRKLKDHDKNKVKSVEA